MYVAVYGRKAKRNSLSLIARNEAGFDNKNYLNIIFIGKNMTRKLFTMVRSYY
jgi:hypothetical protein